MVDVLLGEGVRIDAPSADGTTALTYASFQGHREVIEVLLGKGASIDLQSNNGMTALMLARQQGHTSIEKRLREHAAKEGKSDL